MKHWTLVTPLAFLRAVLRALVLCATALGIFAGGSFGALLPVALFQALGVDSGIVALLAVPGALVGLALAYIAGDRLNERVRRLRAPIGSASIGADGIRWRRLRRTEFVSWSHVRDIEQRGQVVVVHAQGRGEVALQLGEADAFATAARDTMLRYREGEAAEPIAAFEFTGERVADWIGRARGLLQNNSYRDADVGEERCVRVAIDPRAPVAQRIGGAAALSNASEEARQRVRVAIEATADPEIANALEDALEARGDRVITAALRRS
jgi:hypothetical protein